MNSDESDDVDVQHKNDLMYDATPGGDEQTCCGIVTYWLSLDSKAAEYVMRIFGLRNFAVLYRISLLPKKLPAA